MDDIEYINKIRQAVNDAKHRHVVMAHRTKKPKMDDIPFYTNEQEDALNQNQITFTVDMLSQMNANLPQLSERTRKDKFYHQYPITQVINVVDGDEIKTVIPATPASGEICVIDWLSFTVSDITFDDEKSEKEVSDGLRQSMLIKNLSEVLVSILGFGVGEKLPNGIHFYEASYKLEHNCGLVCIGGQNNTILVMINGVGCTYAKQDWQFNLNAFLNMEAVNPKITRIDLAHDDLQGEYSNVAYFAREYDKGGFSMSLGGRKPNIEMRGNWKTPNGKGRTLYIGSSKSPKYCRIYEKGKELGDSNSNWVRTEVEFKAKGQFIPLDVLIKPSNFFLQAYPCFQVFNEHHVTTAKFDRIDKQEMISMSKAVSITKHQFGRFIYAFRREFSKHGLTDKDLLDLLTDIENKRYPERLDTLTIPDFFKKQED